MMTAELRQAARAFAQAVDMAAVGTGDGHARLVLAYRRYLVTLRPETLPSPLRARFLRLHEQICGRPPGGDVDEYIATFKALYPEHAAALLVRLVKLKNALRLLLEEHEI
ncbi:MAG: hypothetical protein ACR2JY_23680 [Chloroflexota bacterium]